MFKTPKIVRPPVDREEYTVQQIEQAFPGGGWVDEPQEGEAEVVEALGCEPSTLEGSSPSSLSLTVIGGTKYDEGALVARLRELPNGTTVYVGAGRGVESDLAKNRHELPLEFLLVDLDVERFGAKARSVNVEHTLCADFYSPVLLVGTGERVKQAKSWLARAKWPREVVEL